MLLIVTGCFFSVLAMGIAIRKLATMDTIVAHEFGCDKAVKYFEPLQ